MAYALTWLSQVLKDANLKVAEVPGWETRGRGDVGPTKGIICHHTAGPMNGNMPSLGTVTGGRPDLPGPLAQLGLGRDGTFYVIAAGRANHAGAGLWKGFNTGNTNFIGIEAENAGTPADAWPTIQVQAYQHGVAAILKHIGADADMCCGHKEYALPAGRKTDPDFDMTVFRAAVAAIMGGTTPPLTLIPAADANSRPTLRRGDSGPAVSQMQADLCVTADGQFGANTEAALRRFQRGAGLVPDGIAGPRTWAALDLAPHLAPAAH